MCCKHSHVDLTCEKSTQRERETETERGRLVGEKIRVNRTGRRKRVLGWGEYDHSVLYTCMELLWVVVRKEGRAVVTAESPDQSGQKLSRQ